MERTRINGVIVATGVVVTLIAACKKDEPAPAQYPVSGYPSGQAYPQQTGAYPTATATAYPTAAPAGTMATPGALALPCQNDSACGFAKCNMQFQKCAFPCQNTALDCAPGNSCNTMTGFCLPGGG